MITKQKFLSTESPKLKISKKGVNKFHMTKLEFKHAVTFEFFDKILVLRYLRTLLLLILSQNYTVKLGYNELSC